MRTHAIATRDRSRDVGGKKKGPRRVKATCQLCAGRAIGGHPTAVRKSPSDGLIVITHI